MIFSAIKNSIGAHDSVVGSFRIYNLASVSLSARGYDMLPKWNILNNG